MPFDFQVLINLEIIAEFSVKVSFELEREEIERNTLWDYKSYGAFISLGRTGVTSTFLWYFIGGYKLESDDYTPTEERERLRAIDVLTL
ncbi:hypothetical protein CHUAL_010495 [Chamberlinius hualienensis]